ncbi:MAG: enoyl-ACP reductase FabI [Alphaproteobacteria bacterium]
MTKLMEGKRGVIMGLANDKSIAWGIAKTLADQGAEIALTYQGETLLKRVEPLASELGCVKSIQECDVTDQASIDTAFDAIEKDMGKIDFLIHAIGFSNKDELQGKYLNTTRDNFLMTMDISCFSFTAVCNRAYKMMNDGGSAITLTYLGSEKYIPNYNVMGVAKAALEASVRYLAVDMGDKGIRVNSLSAGPIRTLAASGIGDFRTMLRWNELGAPMGRNMDIWDIGKSALYLVSDLSSGVSGELHYVDGGYNMVGMPKLDNAGELAEVLQSIADKK